MVINKKDIDKIKENVVVEIDERPIQKESARLTEVVTQKQLAIELEDGKIVTDIELLILIYNKVSKLERQLT